MRRDEIAPGKLKEVSLRSNCAVPQKSKNYTRAREHTKYLYIQYINGNPGQFSQYNDQATG